MTLLSWTTPLPIETATVSLADGGEIILRRYGNPDGQRLVLSHGSGLSVDAYYPFWSLFLDRFDVIVYDLRNHGCNPLGDLAGHTMPMMVWDNLRVTRAIDRHFGARPKIGIYHSVSAATGVFQAIEEDSFAALVLFDPPVVPSGLIGRREAQVHAIQDRLAEYARNRTEHFDEWEDLAAVHRQNRAFAMMKPDAIDLLARTTVRERAAGGGFELCCPPQYEAQLAGQLYKWAVAIDLAAFDFPMKVIGGDPMTPFSFVPAVDPALVSRFDYDFVPDTTHLLQLEEPEACAELVLGFLARI